MLLHQLKTAFRNLWKGRVFSFINLASLSIGISAALVIFLIISYDFSFDKFQENNNRIYRVVTDITVLGETNHNPGVTYPLPAAIKREVTGVEKVVHFYTVDDDQRAKISVPATGKDEASVFLNQKNIVFADAAYFDLIPYKWLAGSSQTAMTRSDQMVLAASVAAKYFPNTPAAQIIGRNIIVNDTIRVQVTGIVKDLNQHTDFNFKIFISRKTLESRLMSNEEQTMWGGANSASQLFVELSKDVSPRQIAGQLTNLYKKYRKPGRLTFANQLQPLRDVHFNTGYTGSFIKRVAHKPTLYGLLTVAVFLILLGCINFINLSTAQAAERAKEVGIRKTMGSSNWQLIIQFFGEAFLLTFFATILTVAITPWLLQLFRDFIPAGIQFELTVSILLFLVAIVIIVSLLSGFYPAFVLSSFKPVSVLKQQIAGDRKRGLWLRKSFIVSQFVIAQVFVVATLIVGKQLNYTLNKDLGFYKDAIIYLRTDATGEDASHRSVFIDKLRAMPEVKLVSLASEPPSVNGAWENVLRYKGSAKEIETGVQVKRADTNYLKLFGIKLLAGRNLSYSDTTKEFLVNETYAHKLGFANADEAVGKNIYWENQAYPIVGVIADFHQRSLHEAIGPLVLTTGEAQMAEINIALQPQNISGTSWKNAFSKIESAWKELYPESVFEYQFLDETIKEYYTAEQQTSQLLMWCAGLTIFISCLGLLGLIAYIAHRRTKEIGIRKVLGASIGSLISLFSGDFIKLVVVAITIATPVGWWFMHEWLQQFAYRIDLKWWLFFMAGTVTLLIAILTVSVQAVRSAMANPVKALRTE